MTRTLHVSHPVLSLLLPALLISWTIASLNPISVRAANALENPVEVGAVNWSRDYRQGLQRSRQSGTPMLLLFQEVPGCIGCQNFGRQVLTHPLLVEAIEDEFVPILIYNNRSGGTDRQLLKQYGEPSWNFQVIRFVNGEERDIIPRRDRVWDIGSVAARMILTLETVNRPAPNYLRSLATEHDGEHLDKAVFGMYCFWTGEYQLGSIPGVVSTEAGFYRGREVVEVTYHRQQISLAQLVEEASARRCARTVYSETNATISAGQLTVESFDPKGYRRAPEADQKRQIRKWLEEHRDIYFSPMQLTKLNSLMGHDKAAAYSWLSPRQIEQLGGKR